MVDVALDKPGLRVVDAAFAGASAPSHARPATRRASIEAEKPTILTTFSADERRVWKYVVAALNKYGFVHRTDSLVLTVIVRVFVQWLAAEDKLAELSVAAGGSFMVKTPNGFEQPHQLYYVAKDLKRQLLQWLPEAALTIPSFAKLSSEDSVPNTPDMFDDPVRSFQDRKKALSGTDGTQS